MSLGLRPSSHSSLVGAPCCLDPRICTDRVTVAVLYECGIQYSEDFAKSMKDQASDDVDLRFFGFPPAANMTTRRPILRAVESSGYRVIVAALKSNTMEAIARGDEEIVSSRFLWVAPSSWAAAVDKPNILNVTGFVQVRVGMRSCLVTRISPRSLAIRQISQMPNTFSGEDGGAGASDSSGLAFRATARTVLRVLLQVRGCALLLWDPRESPPALARPTQALDLAMRELHTASVATYANPANMTRYLDKIDLRSDGDGDSVFEYFVGNDPNRVYVRGSG